MGIPRFVGAGTYADHFGAQWQRFRLTQLDSYTGFNFSRERLRRCLGSAIPDAVAGRRVLECGCGAGRFTEILLAGGATVTSIDLSAAVESNAVTFPPSACHRIAQADILSLPFREQSFDLVLCLGVVQHTPNPERTIAALYDQVAPGGTLVIDHHTFSIGWYTKTAPLFRQWLKRLHPVAAFAVTDRLVNALLPLHKRVARIPILRSVVARISPVLSYYVAYPQLSDALHREWALLDTHDVLTDHYKHFRTARSIRRTMERLGMQSVWCELGGNGVEARGRRPA
jgi:2-polyprenyl-3-methyl-5-hydroxy-6-metoxy-1,4-benzoquinol methylase